MKINKIKGIGDLKLDFPLNKVFTQLLRPTVLARAP